MLVRVVTFAYLWLTIGFAIGTLVLLGPVRWVTGALRAAGRPPAVENAVVMGIIAVYVAGTAALAWVLTRPTFDRARGRWRLAIPAITTAAAALAVGLWFTPALLTGPANAAHQTGQFVFGPYPDSAAMAALKADGFTAVISLLHPAVVPFEPKLLADERSAAAAVGIELIHLPMLPWIGNHEAAIDSVRALAASPGRYYVHCYLGKDRVNVIRRAVEGAQALGRSLADSLPIAAVDELERGAVYALGDGIYLAPYPTDEEWVRFVIGGGIRSVLSLLDATHADDVPHIARERDLAARHDLLWALEPVPALPYRPERALAAVRRARALPRPVLVHAFLSASPPTEGFLQTFVTGAPSVPPSLFLEPLLAGRAAAVAPHVVVGPAPSPGEFATVLYRRGIRSVWYLGSPGDAAARRDAPFVRAAGLRWAVGPGTDTRLAKGGPWYVYGPGSDSAAMRLARALGPPLRR